MHLFGQIICKNGIKFTALHRLKKKLPYFNLYNYCPKLKFRVNSQYITFKACHKIRFVMQKISIISVLFCLVVITSTAQPPKLPLYSINHIQLPPDMNKQVCISGLKYMDGKLFFASERCPMVIVAEPETGSILNKIMLNVPQNFEMEGMTSFENKLYLVSENIAAIYEVNPQTGALNQVEISMTLPPKSKNGDGMEGIAANEVNNKFYLLRERNEERTQTEIYTFSIERKESRATPNLKYESMITLPLENPQWRYSDICFDKDNSRLLCLKSYSKGKLRQQYLESIDINSSGNLVRESLKNIPVDKFSEISNEYKDQDYSMNLEGITIDEKGNIFIVSDNTSGKAQCDLPAKEKTILLELKKQ